MTVNDIIRLVADPTLSTLGHNRFAILFIFMGIWSVIGVEFYRKDGDVGDEAYGDFTKVGI